jgi:hypothetical protein
MASFDFLPFDRQQGDGIDTAPVTIPFDGKPNSAASFSVYK